MNAVLKPFFPKTDESKVIRVSSNEGNLPRSEKKKKTNTKNQYRFALGTCARYHTLSLTSIGKYNVINSETDLGLLQHLRWSAL